MRYGLTDRAELSLSLPYVRNQVNAQHSDEHHRNEVLDGPGDVHLSAKHFFIVTPRSQLSGAFGLSLPTGKNNRLTRASFIDHETAERLGITLQRHSHLQLGTGTVDPILGIDGLHWFDGQWMFYSNAVVNLPFYRNRYGYRTSPNANLTVGAARLFGHLPQRSLGLFLNIYYSGRDHFRGADIVGPGGTVKGSLEVPNTGRFEISLHPSLTFGLTRDTTINLDINAPIYTRIRMDAKNRDAQLTEPASVSLSIFWNF